VNHFITECNLNGYPVEQSSMFYLAGAYNSYVDHEGNAFDINDNIYLAKDASFKLWSTGLCVFCPHLNTRNFHTPHFFGGKMVKIEDSVFTQGLLDNQYRFSALILLHNWIYSRGTKAEIKQALRIGQPIFFYDQVVNNVWDPINTREILHDIREEMARE